MSSFWGSIELPHFISTLPNSISCRLQASAVLPKTTTSQRLLHQLHNCLSRVPITKYMYTHTDLLLSVSQGSIFYILSTASLIEPWASNMGTLENDLDLWIEAGTYPIFYITGLTSGSWKLQCNVWNSKSVSPYFSLKRKEIWDVTESRRTAWANEPTGVSLERTEIGCQV